MEKEGKECFEDRRRASNMNPYLVEAMRISTNPPYEILLLVVVVFSMNHGKICISRIYIFQFVSL
jgi:hypothetical protein